jgi:MFS family permease
MNPYTAVGAIITGIVFLQGGMGLLSVLLPLRMQEAGFNTTEIGIMTAGFATGFFLGCFYGPVLIQRIGHIRAFACFATVLSALTLALAIDTDLALWTSARLLSGICFAGLLNVSDSWISGETRPSMRGRVMSVYMIFYKGAQALGPLVFTFSAISGNWHFMLVSALFSLSLLPVALREGGNPTAPLKERMGLRQVYQTTPLAVVGCMCLGMSNSPMNNLIAIYGVNIGLEISGAVMLSAALQVGALALQWPMGWASDKRDRRKVMIFGMLMMALFSAIIAFMPPAPLWGYVILVGILGGFAMSIYPIVLAHAADYVSPKQMVPLCATLMLAFAVGMSIGPITGSLAMEILGPQGLFIHTIFFSLVFVCFALYRMSKRDARPIDERPTYVNLPASSTAISQLDPRARIAKKKRGSDKLE